MRLSKGGEFHLYVCDILILQYSRDILRIGCWLTVSSARTEHCGGKLLQKYPSNTVLYIVRRMMQKDQWPVFKKQKMQKRSILDYEIRSILYRADGVDGPQEMKRN